MHEARRVNNNPQRHQNPSIWKADTALSEVLLLYRLAMNLYYMVIQLC